MLGSFAKAISQLELWIREQVQLESGGASSMRQTLRSAEAQARASGKYTEEQLAKMFKKLKPVELEPGTEYLAVIFNALSNTRTYGPSGGPMAITHLEMKAYIDLMDCDLEPWEIEAVQVMDRAYVEEIYQSMASRNKKNGTG